jgi:hypothetical protein
VMQSLVVKTVHSDGATAYRWGGPSYHNNFQKYLIIIYIFQKKYLF